MTGKNYRDLVVWQKSMDLVQFVYATTGGWPREELYGLTAQIRRAAVSVPSNIAEGQGRGSNNEFLHHLGIAYGSLMELETQVLLAQRLGYSSAAASEELLRAAAEVGRLLNGLSNSLPRGQPNVARRRIQAEIIPPRTDDPLLATDY